MIQIKKIFPDPLIAYLLIALISAYFFPQIRDLQFNNFDLSKVIDIGVIIVFFFYGLKLKWKEVFQDLRHWKLHVRIQFVTFILFPLLGIFLYPISQLGHSYKLIFLAVFYLCALPSTVSSSVVMVSIAKGNITSAIFNASLSGLLGIILTPLWMSLFIEFNSEIDSNSIVFDLFLKVLLPVFVGALLQPLFGKFYDKYKSQLGNLDKLTIVLIVYNSFSHTFQSNLFAEIGIRNIVLIFILVVALFLVVFYGLGWLNTNFWKFKLYDFITIQFCGTKKSLVHGSVMGSVLFVNDIGIYLLPIMIYHTFQLVFISYKASVYAKEMD